MTRCACCCCAVRRRRRAHHLTGDLRRQRLGDTPVALGIRVYRVGFLVTLIQHVGNDFAFVRDAKLPGDFIVERRCASDQRGLGHAHQHHGYALPLDSLNDRAQIRFGLRFIHLAQHVVAAMAQDQQPGFDFIEHLGKTFQSGRADFAGDAGCDDLPADARFEHRGIAFLWRGAGPEGETVAEGEHHASGTEPGELGRRRAAGSQQRGEEEGEAAGEE